MGKGRGNSEFREISGVIVKYNPCSEFARGSPCPYFTGGKYCGKPPLECEMPEYDKWFKDVLAGKQKAYYYTRSIRLLEEPGYPMFVFHSHYHGIVGEARITESMVKDQMHFYRFQDFVVYPKEVHLELLQSDPRLPKMANVGRWFCVYISSETIEEIRHISNLGDQERKRLQKLSAKSVSGQKTPFKLMLSWKAYMRKETERLKKEHEISEQILEKTKKYFSQAVERGLTQGRSHGDLFYGSLYLAFRMQDDPRLVRDIARISGIQQKTILKVYRLLVWQLGLTVPPLKPKQLIKTYCQQIDLPEKTIDKAISLIAEAKKKNITIGTAPTVIAAVATFAACQKNNQHITKKQIAKTFDVTNLSIRKYAHRLESF